MKILNVSQIEPTAEHPSLADLFFFDSLPDEVGVY